MVTSTSCRYTYRYFSYTLKKDSLKYNIENVGLNFNDFKLHIELFFRYGINIIGEFNFFYRSEPSCSFSDIQNKFLKIFLDVFSCFDWLIGEFIEIKNRIAMNVKSAEILNIHIEY